MRKAKSWIIFVVFLLSQVLAGAALAETPAQEKFPEEDIEKVEEYAIDAAGTNIVAYGYAFSHTNGTFTPITGGTVHGTASNDDTSFPAIDIGFTFKFDGVEYTQVSLQSNGFIAMGATISSSYTPLSTGTSNNVIAGLARDLQGNTTTSELMSLMEGTESNRIFTVQWLHYKRYGSTGTGDDLNFQIKLYEGTNKIEIVYGTALVVSDTTVQVGLRGASNTDFNNRTTTTDWLASTAGVTNTDTMTLTAAIFPATGLTYNWDVQAYLGFGPSQSLGACRGGDAIYNLTAVNGTGAGETVDIATSGNTWTTTLDPTQLILQQDESAGVQAMVHVPWSAATGAIDTATLTATGQISGLTGSATLTTTSAVVAGYEEYMQVPAGRGTRAHSIVYKDGKLYKIGGYGGATAAAQPWLDIYDIATDSWSTGADMPGGRYWIDCEAIGDGIYCAGGYLSSAQSTLYRYDIPGNSWTTLAPLPSGRYSYESVTYNGKYYVIGGYSGSVVNTMVVYDPATDTWDSTLAPMAVARRYFSAGLIGTKIYVAGGYNTTYLNSVEVYDIVANTWAPATSMPTNWLNGADAVMMDRYLIIIGGASSSTAAASNYAWIYDSLTDQWGQLPTFSHMLYGADAEGDGTNVFVVSGRLYEGTFSYSQYNTKLLLCDQTCTPVTNPEFTFDPLEGLLGSPITFTGTVGGGSPAIQYAWDFGDSTTGTGQEVEHTYAAVGTYTVTLTVTNCEGASTANISHDVTVILPPTIRIDPTSLHASQHPDVTTTQTFEICNLGDAELTWELNEALLPPPAAAPTSTVPEAAVVTSGRAAISETGIASGTAVIGEASGGIKPEDVGDAWEIMAPLPEGRVFNAVIADGTYVYVIGGTSDPGGLTPTSTNFRYDTFNNTWQTMTSMPVPLGSIDGAVIDGKIYIPGGATDSNTYVYDIATDSWATIPTSGGYVAGEQYQVVAIDTDLYVLGGIVSGASTTAVWKLDTLAETWSVGIPMQTSRTSFSAAAIDGEIYVAGGVLYPGFTPDMTAEKFDGTAWSYIAAVPNGGGAYTRWSYNADGNTEDSLWLAAGRRDADWNVLNHAGYYDPELDAWTDSPTIPVLNQGRVYMEGDVAGDGYFYVIGGRDGAASIAYDTNERLRVVAFDIPWASEDPLSGALAGGACQDVTVTFDSTGLAAGDYFGALEIESNDPAMPMAYVDLQLTVFATVTMVYYDLEDVVHVGENIYVAGDFNGWDNNLDMMTPNTDYSEFTFTFGIPDGTYEYKYVVDTGVKHWNWLQSSNRSFTVPGDDTIDDYRNVIPGYYELTWPDTMTVLVNTSSENVYGQIWADDLTSEGVQPRSLPVELGYGVDADPSLWTNWTLMSFNVSVGNNAEYMGSITPTEPGVFSYAIKLNPNWGTGNPNSMWYYADTEWDGTYMPEDAGVMTVLSGIYLPLILK